MNTALIDHLLCLIKTIFKEQHEHEMVTEVNPTFLVKFDKMCIRYGIHDELDHAQNKENMKKDWSPHDGFELSREDGYMWHILAIVEEFGCSNFACTRPILVFSICQMKAEEFLDTKI